LFLLLVYVCALPPAASGARLRLARTARTAHRVSIAAGRGSCAAAQSK